MKAYIGAKIIKAEPMSLGEYNKFRGWDIPKNEDPNRQGYHVVYPNPDGEYHSWSPKEVFEEAYRPVTVAERDMLRPFANGESYVGRASA